MKKNPNILFVCAGSSEYPSNKISYRTLSKYFSVRRLVSGFSGYYTRTLSVVLRLPFYLYGTDLIYVGWMGQHLVPFIRLFSRKPIIFDVAPSLYDTFLVRGFARPDSWKARLLFFLDTYAYKKSSAIIVGEKGSADYFSNIFNIPLEKFRVFPICADNTIFYPHPRQQRVSKNNGKFIVEFVGDFAPQHGVSTIIEAAKILENKGVYFQVAGTGQSAQKVLDTYRRLNPVNIEFIPHRISLEKLLIWRAESNLCLGLFGDTPKTRRSLSNKLFEALAMGKPFLTAGPPKAFGVALHFRDNEDCFFGPLADSQGLAEKILWIRDNHQLREHVAIEGRKTYERICSENVIETRIVNLVREVLYQ